MTKFQLFVALILWGLVPAAWAQVPPTSTDLIALRDSGSVGIKNGCIAEPGGVLIQSERIVDMPINVKSPHTTLVNLGKWTPTGLIDGQVPFLSPPDADALQTVQESAPQRTISARLAAGDDFSPAFTWERFGGTVFCKASLSPGGPQPSADAPAEHSPTKGNRPGEDATIMNKRSDTKPPDFNRDIYYRNKLEFSLDVGWLPINIPFPLDVFVGDAYNTYPLKYTLVPVIASLRWQIDNVGSPWILRGNWDLTFSGSVTAIPRGPETRYFSYDMGIRRNFVQRNWRIAPYFDIRLGVGNIDAKGPKGVLYAQGQDLTFTVNMGSGVRYNFSPRYGISAGLNVMHISNLDLSESNGKPNWGVRNYGINVYGPMVGIDMQLRRHPHSD